MVLFYGSAGVWVGYTLLLLFSPWKIELLIISNLVITGLIASYIGWIGKKLMEAIKLEDDEP
jgi:hypothetical protein